MTDIEIFGKEFDDVVGFKMPDLLGDDVTFTEGGGGSPTLETVTKTYTPTESQQTETITPSSGYDGIEEVDVTVNAISSSYVGTGVIRDSGKTVTPTTSQQQAVAAGVYTTAPTYVGAIPSEYVVPTGTKSITANGTNIDVTNYAAVDVNVSGGGTPSLTSLTAVYTQSGTVYTTDDLSVLIPDLVVTGVFNYGLSVDIASTDYTLTGTLTEGTSTITVSYGGMTDTFTVVATAYWDYYWDYHSGILPQNVTFTTNGDATYSLTANGLAMTSSTTSSYVYFRLDNYQTTTHGMLEVVGNVSTLSNAYNNWRICVADGTNGAQTCMGDHYFRILNSTTGSSTERLCYANANQDYTVRVTYYKNGSSITGSYRVDGCLLRSGYASSNVKYTTATRVWCQTMGGTLLIKQIKYRDMQ